MHSHGSPRGGELAPRSRGDAATRR